MMIAEAGWVVLHSSTELPKDTVTMGLNRLLACAALAVGLQGGAMLQLKIPGIVTTYITGTWTTLMNGLVHFVTQARPQEPREETQFEERLWMQSGISMIYFLSALLTGLLFRYLPRAVGVLPASCLPLVSGYSAFHCRDPRR